MGLLSCLWGGVVLSVKSNSFVWGFWSLGVGSLFAGLSMFMHMSVECSSEILWNNGFSSSLVLVTLWVGGACYLSTDVPELEDKQLFGLCVLVLSVMSCMFFLVANWFILFFFFEGTLFPIIMLILGWGYQPERLQAAGYMVMYTVCASLPMLASLVWVFYESGSVSLFSRFISNGSGISNELLFVGVMVAFLVKSPVFMLHSWLPKAHVEAPVAASMMLAGVLLKFGGYGCVVSYYFMIPDGWGFTWCAMGLTVVGGLFCSVMCFRQVDMKSMIAYSSIGHMALCMGGFFSCYSLGWQGGLVLMVAHGLCSPGLFALSGFTYSLFSSRSLLLCKGVLSLVPSLSLAWFLFCSCNMGFPPSAGLLGEILLIIGLVSYYYWFLVPLILMAVVTGAYSLILYCGIQHGKASNLSLGGGSVSSKFLTMCWMLWVPLNLLTAFSGVLGGTL